MEPKQKANRHPFVERSAMIKKRYLVALGAISAALGACGSSDVNGPGGTPNGSGATAGTTGGAGGASASGGSTTGGSSTGGSTTGGTGGSTTGGTGGSAAGGSGGEGAVATCVPGIPTSSQIPRLMNWQYDAVVRDLLGVTTLGAEGKPPSAQLYADFDGPMLPDAWRFYQDVGAQIAAAVMAGADKSKFIACDPAAAGCMTDTIKAFGRKAFRRPLTPAEEASFARLGSLMPAGTPAEVAEATLYAFLVSPSFIYRTETTSVAEGTAIKLSGHEVAARLSFLLWGSVPDDVLNAAADADALQTKAQILEQATRMIAVREKTAPLVAGFHRKYMDMGNSDAHWFKIQHDKTLHPLYDETAEPSLMSELDMFFEEVAFGGGSFKDIFTSNVAFVTNKTAAIYGLDPAAYGPELTKVNLDAAQRPGFLTRIGFLSSYSHFDTTSPILRGAYITVNILGVNPGAPDPEAFKVPAPEGDYRTERAYVEALTGQTACRGCHIPYVNPPGYVLENYDAIGKWQTLDMRNGGDTTAGAINPVSTVTFSETNVKPVNNALELMTEIGTNVPSARRIYAEKAVAFTTGRQPNPNDACTVDELNVKLAADGYTVLNLLADITQADSFRLRVRETP
jgi:hypothetical protein